jgi:hypothetical protein
MVTAVQFGLQFVQQRWGIFARGEQPGLGQADGQEFRLKLLGVNRTQGLGWDATGYAGEQALALPVLAPNYRRYSQPSLKVFGVDKTLIKYIIRYIFECSSVYQ